MMTFIISIILPYLAVAVFVGGLGWRMWRWAKTPVPFRIPTSCGQQKSLAFIPRDRLDNPAGTIEVVGRMALEVLLFRSLFRNNKVELHDGRLVYGGEKWLWAAALAFHWSLLVILVRHLRLFLDPVPGAINLLTRADGFFEVLTPTVFATDFVILAALSFLFARRVVIPQVRFITLPADWFALVLIFSIAASGVIMRQFWRTDLQQVKALAVGLATFAPVVPVGVGLIFYIHLFLVCVLLIWFPFSKLVHLGGVFLSPTRNLVNNSRATRHVNPWNYPVKTHTYAEWEEEFHDVIKASGLPMEKE